MESVWGRNTQGRETHAEGFHEAGGSVADVEWDLREDATEEGEEKARWG